jgi:hypothetical protein
MDGDDATLARKNKQRNRTNVQDNQIEEHIRVYVAKNQTPYERFKKARAEHQPGSEKAARVMFGRNALSRAVGKSLGLRISGSRISRTTAWAKIKSELLLDDVPSENRRGQQIGMEIAVEKAAERMGDTTTRAVLDRELIERIRRELPEDAANDLISQYQLGTTTEDGIEFVLQANADQ